MKGSQTPASDDTAEALSEDAENGNDDDSEDIPELGDDEELEETEVQNNFSNQNEWR